MTIILKYMREQIPYPENKNNQSFCDWVGHLGVVSFLPNQFPISIEGLPWLVGTLAARKTNFYYLGQLLFSL